MRKVVYGLFLLAFAASATAQESGEWTHRSELGVTDVKGNADTTVVNADHKSVYEKGKNTFGGVGNYNYGTARAAGETEKTLNVRDWGIGLIYEREVSDRFSWYVQSTTIGDQFQDIRWRTSFDLPGLKYQFIKQDNAKDRDYLYATFAYRFSVEELRSVSVEDKDNHHSVLGVHYSKPVGKAAIFLTDIEWMKRYTNDDRDEVRLFVGIESTLSETFAMKVGYDVFYNSSLKAPSEDTTRTFTAALIANY